jgi:pilus assembly protein Flp/PilA
VITVARRFLADDRGTTAIEYALIASLVFMAIVASVTTVGEEVAAVFKTSEDGFKNAAK